MQGITKKSFPKALLVIGIGCGILAGVYAPKYILYLKPAGDIFLNLLITAVVPLVFFAVSSSIANFSPTQKVSRLIFMVIVVFLGTVLFAGMVAEIALRFFPITFDFARMKIAIPDNPSVSQNRIVQMFTVDDFKELLSEKAMLPLIVLSILIGVAAKITKSDGEAFRKFLLSGNAVMKSLIEIIMSVAPVGLGIYFGCQLASMGPQSATSLTQILLVSCGILLFYYFFILSGYTYLTGGFKGTIRYWKNNLAPSLTAVSTSSSIASLPSNLEVAEKMGIPARVGNFALPLGAIVHKEGSAIAAIVAVSVITRGITGWDGALMALFVAALVSIIAGSIPNGGYTGIFFIVAVYHLSAEVVPLMIIVSTVVDPLVTLLNVTGDTASTLLVTRLLGER